MKQFQKITKALSMELREHKTSFFVYFSLRLIVVLVMILQVLNKNYENVFYCILTLLLLILPSLIQMTFKVELPSFLECIILLFIFAAEILGEIDHFYLKFEFWDTMLHTMNGFLAAAIGYSLVDLLNKNEKIQFQLSPIFVSIVAFCFSMTIGVLWEFFEFSLDQFLGMDTQKDTIIHTIHTVALNTDGSVTTLDNIQEVIINGMKLPVQGYIDIGLIDTMEDLFVNFIGALIFSIFGYFYAKNRHTSKLVNLLIPTRKQKNRDFLKIAEEQMREETSAE